MTRYMLIDGKLYPHAEVMDYKDEVKKYQEKISQLESQLKGAKREMLDLLKKLYDHANAYQEIDNKIHSRREPVSSKQVIEDAEVYTWARKDLILTLREAAQKLKEMEGE